MSQTMPLSCSKIHQRSIPCFLQCAVLKKDVSRLGTTVHGHQLVFPPLKAKAVSLLFQQYHSRRDLRILQTHNTAQFSRYCSRDMSKQKNHFLFP